jgi:hypothetical protein
MAAERDWWQAALGCWAAARDCYRTALMAAARDCRQAALGAAAQGCLVGTSSGFHHLSNIVLMWC